MSTLVEDAIDVRRDEPLVTGGGHRPGGLVVCINEDDVGTGGRCGDQVCCTRHQEHQDKEQQTHRGFLGLIHLLAGSRRGILAVKPLAGTLAV